MFGRKKKKIDESDYEWLGGGMPAATVNSLFPTVTTSSSPIVYGGGGGGGGMLYIAETKKTDYDALPRSESTESIKAQKTGYLKVDKGGRIRMGSYNTNRIYDVEDSADHLEMDYTAGEWKIIHGFKPDCSCGFYALKDFSKEDIAFNQILLDVELSGLVVDCEFGYRAEKQKVKRIGIQNTCECDKEAIGVYLSGGALVPTCGHVNTPWVNYTIVTLEELSADLGVECYWREPQDLDAFTKNAYAVSSSTTMKFSNNVWVGSGGTFGITIGSSSAVPPWSSSYYSRRHYGSWFF